MRQDAPLTVLQSLPGVMTQSFLPQNQSRSNKRLLRIPAISATYSG